MDVWFWALLAVAAILVIAVAVFWSVRRRQQRRELLEWFDPEYARGVESGKKASGGRRRGARRER